MALLIALRATGDHNRCDTTYDRRLQSDHSLHPYSRNREYPSEQNLSTLYPMGRAVNELVDPDQHTIASVRPSRTRQGGPLE